MKKILFFSLLLFLLPFEWGHTTKVIYPNQQIQKKLVHKSNVFNKEITHFITLVETKKFAQFKQQYCTTRAAYKAIETYIVFRYPQLDKAINGGPVPSITKEVVILHKDDPSGLQVIEELLDAPNKNKSEIARQLQLLEKNAQQILKVIPSIPIQNWEVLEANHGSSPKVVGFSI